MKKRKKAKEIGFDEFELLMKPKPTTPSPKKPKRGVKYTEYIPIDKKTIVPNRGGREATRLEISDKSLSSDEIERDELEDLALLKKQQEYKQIERKNEKVCANINPTLEWHTWVQCKTNISYSRGSSSGLARRDPIADVAALRAAAMAAVAELQK